jgi:hypothetical protein
MDLSGVLRVEDVKKLNQKMEQELANFKKDGLILTPALSSKYVGWNANHLRKKVYFSAPDEISWKIFDSVIENDLPLVTIQDSAALGRGKDSPFEVFYKHPDFPKIYKLLMKNQVEVGFDFSLALTKADAYFSSRTKFIGMSPNSSWHTFMHEYQHYLFDHLIQVVPLEKLVEATKNNIPLSRLAPFGASVETLETLKLLEVVLKKDFLRDPALRTAIDETLAVKREKGALRGFALARFYTRLDVESYALAWQMEVLAKKASSSDRLVERYTDLQKLEKLKTKFFFLKELLERLDPWFSSYRKYKPPKR